MALAIYGIGGCLFCTADYLAFRASEILATLETSREFDHHPTIRNASTLCQGLFQLTYALVMVGLHRFSSLSQGRCIPREFAGQTKQYDRRVRS